MISNPFLHGTIQLNNIAQLLPVKKVSVERKNAGHIQLNAKAQKIPLVKL